MHSSLTSHFHILELHTRLFLNCLEDIDDGVAQKRVNPQTNHVAFIACHLFDARHYLATYLGAQAKNPFKKLLDGVRTIDEIERFPALEQVRRAWREISQVLAQRFESLSQEELNKESPQKFPVGDPSVLGGVTFLMQHEAYHIGQLAFLRKYFGFGAMRY